MGFLQTVDESDATGAVAKMYDEERAEHGYVANYAKTFSLRPAVYAAWDAMNGAIKASAEPRGYRVATVAAARELRSTYCALAHSQVLVDQFVDEQTVRDLIAGDPGGRLGPVDTAVAALAAGVVQDATSVGEDDFAELRRLGFSDPEIFDVILAAAARCFFSTVLDATGTLADSSFRSVFDDDTRHALTVGRPIAD